LNECETWSLILREGHRLNVFILRKIHDPRMEEVMGLEEIACGGALQLQFHLNICFNVNDTERDPGW
jgi:hypothetical protein